LTEFFRNTLILVHEECRRQFALSGLSDEIKQAINRRNVMFNEHPMTLVALPIAAFDAAGGSQPETAVTAAAAIEFLLAAADVLDDLQDGEPHDASCSSALCQDRYINEAEVLTALLLLVEQSSLSLFDTSQPCDRVVQAISRFNQFKFRSFRGQYSDAHSVIDSDASPEVSLQIVVEKSGSLGRCAGEFGAALATDNEATVKKLGQFGEHLAVASQFNDDVANLWPRTGKLEDLEQLKKTLPLTFSVSAARHRAGAEGHALVSMVQPNGSATNGVNRVLDARDEVFALGGIHFAMLQATIHLAKARTIACEFKDSAPDSKLLELLRTV
jgi:geranylgeranyl pyrophosphate synthase